MRRESSKGRRERYRLSSPRVSARQSVNSRKAQGGNELMLAVSRSCPEVAAPNGSYVSNGTATLRTFLCRSGGVFPDTGERKRTLECRNGKWNETVVQLPACVRMRGKHSLDKSIISHVTKCIPSIGS